MEKPDKERNSSVLSPINRVIQVVKTAHMCQINERGLHCRIEHLRNLFILEMNREYNDGRFR